MMNEKKPMFLAAKGISKKYHDIPAVDNVSLEVERGEFFALLGPSGSGKTTFLRILAGFVTPDAGKIFLDGNDITALAANRRNMAMVFQNFSLWPHMTVFSNIAYGLRLRKMPESYISDKVSQLLSLVRLENRSSYYPQQLSGGQQQRVALARALAIDPEILLLDEPLSNLDLNLREELRREIRHLQRQLKITTIYVTHDQTEAMFLADRIAVMDRGIITEIGSPWQLYWRPVLLSTARFFGDINEFPGTVSAINKDNCVVDTVSSRIVGSVRPGIKAGLRVISGFRPENIKLGKGTVNNFSGNIEILEFHGNTIRLTVSTATGNITISLPGEQFGIYKVGSGVEFHVEPSDILIFPENI
jgi:putative spermidine/putrescine transport system ATP-binding protein